MMPLPPGDWDDDRLHAAFAARSASTPPTPSDIGDEALARLVRGERRISAWPRFAVTGAAAALVVVLAGSMLVRQNEPDPGASSAPSFTDAAPTVEPVGAILEALGGPITVSEALEVRDVQRDDREFAVRGFLAPSVVLACAAPQGNPWARCAPYPWVMEEQERLPNVTGPPTGPAFIASFQLVFFPWGPSSDVTDEGLLPVVLVGHFHDRRAASCKPDEREACGETFVVDRVVEVSGDPLPVSTQQRIETASKDSADVVDALALGAAPESIVVSRQLIAISSATRVEPVLANDGVIPNWGDPSAPLWLVTTVDASGATPIARTFGLIDGSNWFAEITAEGAIYLERSAPTPTSAVEPNLPSADPSAFDGAPTSVLGIPVRDIQTLQLDRQTAVDGLGRDEVALRAWYLGPNPAVTCADAPPPIHEPRPPCDEARHWLLDDPSQFGHEPGQSRLNPSTDHYTPVLNPLLPVDVDFDVSETWRDGTPVPRPVIVLGHFGDHRVDTYAGNLYFVIDALAWTPDRTVGSFDTVVRLATSATENIDAVLGRISAIGQRDAVATWVTVVEPADFVLMDRRSESMSEFTTGAPVWMVGRLVHDETDGRQRLGVVWGWTADGGKRVWWEECPDCGPDLGTTLDIRDLDENTPIVRVYDYSDVITAVGPATGLSGLSWRQPRGNATDHLDVARGRTAREVVIRWFSPSCPGIPWNVKISDYANDGGFGFSVFTRGEACEGGDRVVRRIVLEFDHPIDIDKIDGPSCCG